MKARILTGDCRDVLETMDAESVDAVCTDPPYGYSFMGKDWDHEVPGVAFWEAMYRVMKPGAHLLAFGGTRTFHRIAVAIEDAGFEIRDTLMWLYGSGFPKSHDVSKAIDKAAGAEREVIGDNPNRKGRQPEGYHDGWARPWQADTEAMAHKITAPATPEAEQWQGWGTALKPSFEPIILARKPLAGTVAANVLTHGTGALNIDASRIGTEGGTTRSHQEPYGDGGRMDQGGSQPWRTGHAVRDIAAGRWPANVILDEVAAAQLDAQSGELSSGAWNGKRNTPKTRGVYGEYKSYQERSKPADTGGASRFFKVVAQDENPCNHAEFMVQYDCNCEAVEGDQWVKQGHQASIQAESDTPLQRDTTDSPSGTANERAPLWHTSTNGSSTTAPSPTATRSTTSTATSKTTASRTCNCSTPQPTSESTPVVNSEMVSGGNHAPSVASSSLSTPNTGTSAPKAGHSTDVADRAISAGSLPINNGDAPASRFLYVPKASRRERNMGLPEGETSTHPTVKPLALMRYLIQMVTPPGGVILDPFMGSGSTLVAAAELGFNAIGIELSEEYAEIAARRVDHALNGRAGKLPLPLGIVS